MHTNPPAIGIHRCAAQAKVIHISELGAADGKANEMTINEGVEQTRTLLRQEHTREIERGGWFMTCLASLDSNPS